MSRETLPDTKVANEVLGEWMRGAGADNSVRTVVSYIGMLQQRFGNGFTIEGAASALDRLSEDAQAIKSELIKAKSSIHTSNPSSAQQK